MAQKRAIVLERVPGSAGMRTHKVALWFPVPAGNRQAFYANPQAPSIVKGIAQADLDAIRAGLFVEEEGRVEVPDQGTTAQQNAALQREVETMWQARYDALSAADPARWYGKALMDDGTWV